MTSRRATLAIAGLALAAGAPALFGDFVLDDAHAVLGSSCVRGEVPLPELWRRNYWCQPPEHASIDAWRPWPVLVWRGLWALGGGHPAPFHALSVALHAAIAVLVRALVAHASACRGATASQAARHGLWAGLAFAAAAVHAEAIASVVAVADLWAALGTILVLHLSSAHARGWWWPIAGAAVVALLSKETSVVVLAPSLGLAALAARTPLRRRLLAAAGLAAALTVVVVALRVLVHGTGVDAHTSGMVNPLVGAPWIDRVPTALSLFGRSLAISGLGHPLAADHGLHDVTVGTFDGWAALGLAGTLGALALALRQRKDPHVIAWLGVLGGSWLVLGQLLVPLPVLLAERLLELPSVALVLALAAAMAGRRVPTRAARPLALLGAGWIAVQLCLCMVHAFAWTSEDRITQTTVDHAPDSVRAHEWRARVLLRDPDPERRARARAHVDTAIALEPAHARPWAFRGVLLDEHGDPEAALDAFAHALELDPSEPEVADLFIQFLLRHGHREPARFVYARHAHARGGRPHPDVPVP